MNVSHFHYDPRPVSLDYDLGELVDFLTDADELACELDRLDNEDREGSF
jgi:hypothetical protein